MRMCRRCKRHRHERWVMLREWQTVLLRPKPSTLCTTTSFRGHHRSRRFKLSSRSTGIQTVTQHRESEPNTKHVPRHLPRPLHPLPLPRLPIPRQAVCHEVRICATRIAQGLRILPAPPCPTPSWLLRDPRTRPRRPPLPTGPSLRRCLVHRLRKRRSGSPQDRCTQQPGRVALTHGPV